MLQSVSLVLPEQENTVKLSLPVISGIVYSETLTDSVTEGRNVLIAFSGETDVSLLSLVKHQIMIALEGEKLKMK